MSKVKEILYKINKKLKRGNITSEEFVKNIKRTRNEGR